MGYSGTSNYSACSVQTNGELIRDDIMAASIDSTKAAFPLNITVHGINATFRAGSQPDPWANAVLFTFSEVDFDDENDADMEAQGGSNACVVSNGPEQATVDSNGPVQATVVTVHGHYQDAHSEDKKDVPA